MTGTGAGENPSGGDVNHNAKDAVEVLLQALPFIEKFRGSVVVVKFGGNAMSSPELFADFAKDIVMMHRVGMKPVVVHGGGPQIGEWLRRIGKETEFVDGRRVTDAETLEIAQMVLIGKVNSDIVTALNTYGPVALGLAGTDAMLLTAEARDDALGFAGTVTKVNPELISRTLMMDLIPVIATIGADSSGQTYNINADDAATEIAQELKAEKLIFLSDVPGVLADRDDPESLLPVLTADEVRDLIDSGVINGGMIPKSRACVDAISAGVGSAHMVDGRVPHVLLLELLTNAGVGTMISETPK